jgi:hypothetical protein
MLRPVRSLIIVFALMAAMTPFLERTLKAQDGKICVQYPFMFHGTYTTYYAQEHFATSPFCRNPFSFNSSGTVQTGSCDLGGAGCFTPTEKQRNQMTLRGKADDHSVGNGIDAPNKVRLNYGASIVGNKVSVVEFRKAGTPPKILKAHVFQIHVNPSLFVPAVVGEEKDFYIGYEIRGNSASSDRAYKDDPTESQVRTEVEDDPDHPALVKIRVQVDLSMPLASGQLYDILLLKTPGP